MSKEYFDDQLISNQSAEEPLAFGEYENCEFKNCQFSNADWQQMCFNDCVFDGCDLTGVKISHASLRSCKFKNCKMLGMQFAECNPLLFEVRFENCTLDFSSFFQLGLKKTVFKHCSLKEVDFSESNLQEASFAECDLEGAVFDRTVLIKADFRSAINYAMNPEQNSLKNARFNQEGLIGLLGKYQIKVE